MLTPVRTAGAGPDAPALALAPLTPPAPVVLVPWPRAGADAARRQHAARGRPRLLVVDDGAAPPCCPDPLEDWVRVSAPADEHARRTATLARRHRQRGGIVVADGAAWRGTTAVPLAPRPRALAGQLAAEFGRPVAFTVLTRAAAAEHAGGVPAGLVRALRRLDRRLAPLGVAVVVLGSAALLCDDEVYGAARVRKRSGNSSA